MYYSSFGTLALAIHLIINFNVFRIQRNEAVSETGNRYRLYLICLGAYYITDILWGLLYENELIILTFLDTVFYFAAMALSVLFWTRYVVSYLNNENYFARFLSYAGWLILIFQLMVLVMNFFIPVMFWFDENDVYLPGVARYATLALQVGLFFLTSVYTFAVALRSKGKIRFHHLIIGMSGMVMLIFILLQNRFPLLPFYAVGCLLATCMIHTFVNEAERIERNRELGSVRKMAFTDQLTGVKNMHAYVDMKKEMEKRIAGGKISAFGLVVFDLNDLKKINDGMGHAEGDKRIKEACSLICHLFKHSPVYRIGGDEFVALLEGNDYDHRNSLLSTFEDQVDSNRRNGGVVVASGMSIYIPQNDWDLDAVFGRADHKMIERKRALKMAGDDK